MGAGFRIVAAVSGMLLGAVLVVPALAAEEEAGGPEECFVVADGTADEVDGGAEDLLTRVNRMDSDPVTNETDVGSGTGTFNVEAIALQPGTGVLFAADAGVLGTLDVDTGHFTELGEVGTGSGELGQLELDDIDGLTFDPGTGFLYGTQRRSEEDLLLRLDPATGTVVERAIGGEDYGVVQEVDGLPDIDDIAIDPVDGQMYAVANDNGRDDRLVTIDKSTGAATDIGPMQAEDVEGLGFASGQLIGTTGKVHGNEGIWDIDKSTGAAVNQRRLDNARDYEAFDCLNPPTPAVQLSCLVVSVDAAPDDPVDFPFDLAGETLPAEVTLDDDPGSDTPSTEQYCELPAGTYGVTQRTPLGWTLESVSCSRDPGGDAVVDADGPRVAVDLAGGETVTCFYRNSPLEVGGRQQAGGLVGTPAPGDVAAPAPAPAPAEATAPPQEVGPATAAPESLAELPRTGRDDNRHLLLMAGMGLALGGLGVVGGTPRPGRRQHRRLAPQVHQM